MRFPDVVYSRQFDYGGMFDGEAGVRRIGDNFHAYVASGWGGGRQGPAKPDLETAQRDIERLMSLEFGSAGRGAES